MFSRLTAAYQRLIDSIHGEAAAREAHAAALLAELPPAEDTPAESPPHANGERASGGRFRKPAAKS